MNSPGTNRNGSPQLVLATSCPPTVAEVTTTPRLSAAADGTTMNPNRSAITSAVTNLRISFLHCRQLHRHAVPEKPDPDGQQDQNDDHCRKARPDIAHQDHRKIAIQRRQLTDG